MKHILSTAVGLALASTASAQVLVTDDFSYTGALTANGWTAHSGAGNKAIQSNGAVATLDFSSGSGEDVNLAFAPLAANDDVYASFVLNVPSGNPVNPDNNGSYFAHFKDASFGFRGRFGLLSPAASGDFQVAINASSSSLGGGGVWPSDLLFDTNYTIVISYDAATGESKLWVDPVDASSASVAHTGSAGTLIESIALRQAADHTGFITVDDVVVGNTFLDVVPCTNCAAATLFGAGCGDASASFYEQSDPASFDLGGQTVTGTWTGNGYLVSTAAGSVAPVGGSAVALALGDDDSIDTSTAGGTLGLWVGSNCWIALGGGNSNGFSPSSSTMLSNPSTGVYAWTDLRPLQPSGVGLGTVYYEENGTVATVTYDAVEGWNTGTTNTVQFTYDTGTGDYSITFGALSTTNPEDWLVGYSTGGASVDPGPTDISAGAFSTPAADTPAMALSSDLPNVGQDWTLDLDNVSGPFCWFFFGDAAVDPGYDLTPNGAPGCFVYSTANLGFWVQPILSGTGSMSFGIPADSSLVGTELTAQGAALVPSNALNFGTSNGISAKVGS